MFAKWQTGGLRIACSHGHRDATQYAQIEKELLAVVFACTKFEDYVYGKATVVKTDRQPLVTIMKKPIHVAPAWLQRILLAWRS